MLTVLVYNITDTTSSLVMLLVRYSSAASCARNWSDTAIEEKSKKSTNKRLSWYCTLPGASKVMVVVGASGSLSSSVSFNSGGGSGSMVRICGSNTSTFCFWPSSVIAKSDCFSPLMV